MRSNAKMNMLTLSLGISMVKDCNDLGDPHATVASY